MTTASSAAAVGIRQARLACKLESHRGRNCIFGGSPAGKHRSGPWASVIPRFKRRCSDRDGNTRWKSKAGRSGKGSCTDCRTVLYASPNHKLENFNERQRLVSPVDFRGPHIKLIMGASFRLRIASYSVRSACMGSITAARRAGMNPAVVAQSPSTKVAPTSASGS